MAVQLNHGTTTVLYHEPEGLLLQASLVDLPGEVDQAGIAFQLSYQGWGEITVAVATGGRPDGVESTGQLTEVTLQGGGGFPGAGGWTSVLQVPTTAPVQLRYTVLGQPGADDPLRGRLDCDLTGTLARLTATTVMGVSIEPLSASQ